MKNEDNDIEDWKMSERIINDIGTFMFGGGPPRCPKCGKLYVNNTAYGCESDDEFETRKENICGCEESK